MKTKQDILQGTLDLIVLKTLDILGPQHGYGIAQRVQQVSDGLLFLNQGTLYPALIRLEQKGWVESEYGPSENNRKARFYSLTRQGKKQLIAELEQWELTVSLMSRLLEAK
jgi:PadR family transcriptional regulator PadR